MARSESIFLIQIYVEELESFCASKSFRIVAKFGDVFKIQLRNPNKLVGEPSSKQYGKRKLEKRPPTAQTVKIASDIESLVTNMLKFPLELNLFSNDDPYTLGIAEIPWNPAYVDYLNNIQPNDDTVFTIREAHRVFDDYTSKYIADIKLQIKMNQVKNQVKEDTSLRCQTVEKYQFLDVHSMEPGTIKTFYRGRKQRSNNRDKSKLRNKKLSNTKTVSDVSETIAIKDQAQSQAKNNDIQSEKDIKSLFHCKESDVIPSEKTKRNSRSNIVSLIRSQTDMEKRKQLPLKRWSGTSIEIKQHLDTLNYIFGNHHGPFGNRVYCVGYCTIQNDLGPNNSTGSESATTGSLIPVVSPTDTSRPTVSSSAISAFACSCLFKNQELTSHAPATLVELKQTKVENIGQVVGGMVGAMQLGQDTCYCTCECTFGFIKKTTYCEICGGYEKMGDEPVCKRGDNLPPFPCPIYHKLGSGKKLTSKGLDSIETGFNTASVADKATTDSQGRTNQKELDKRSGDRQSDKRSLSEKDNIREKLKNIDAEQERRYKYFFGYKAPQMSQLADCGAFLNSKVPKEMGWLWTATDVPGMKPRALWRPGAANKHVVRMLKRAKNPDQVMSRRKRTGGHKKSKRSLKRPLLTVQKTEGEYTVTLETMKQYSKPRAPNQAPYEEKPLVTYTIGRTDLENLKLKKKKERAARRLEREQRAFIQSTFKNMCTDICQKTCDQALGLLPFAEDPPCPCYPIEPDNTKISLSHSCSCSESTLSSGSASDDDEWLVEVTPPIAFYDPNWAGKRIYSADHGTQYTYLDYKVKLLDKSGNPIPRYFTGPDGKQQCSDLGGFWSPENHWLEINSDGFIGPDGRWAPNFFHLANGERIDADEGEFETRDGTVMRVGVDGYVDVNGIWQDYPKSRTYSKCTNKNKTKVVQLASTKAKDGKEHKKKSETTFSCFGDTSPRTLSQMRILGHGHDRKLLLETLEKLMKYDQSIKIPTLSKVPAAPKKKGKIHAKSPHAQFLQDHKCTHLTPSDKGILIDEQGRKRYFTPSDYKNPRPKNRLTNLAKSGISVSSFHVPCYDSFISSEALRHQQYDHIKKHNDRVRENRES